ncbi:hypothetical protein [Candidatus Vallotia tarda]|uniref:hypothetical protein n=1 Tax=Candidatus Vallotiella hemipterorum TaxID=1177213 RepID=UPI001C1F3E25|nr:hypothetical protein [Candidatus Vallotia tarda]
MTRISLVKRTSIRQNYFLVSFPLILVNSIGADNVTSRLYLVLSNNPTYAPA